MLTAGTPHKPPLLNPAGYCIHEGTACAEYLMSQGVQANRILKESSSYDTVGNGYFAATIHALPAAWTSVGVVTSNFHMPRSREIFETTFKLMAKRTACRVDLMYYGVSDDGVFEDDVLQARIRREQASLKRFRDDAAKLNSLEDLHEWLFSTHLCYAVPRQHEMGVPTQVDDKALASY